MSFAVTISAILDTCAGAGAAVRSALVVGPEHWKSTLSIGYGVRTLGFADPSGLEAALFATVPTHSVAAIRDKGGEAVQRGLTHALDLVVVDLTACQPGKAPALPVDFLTVSAVLVLAVDDIPDLAALTPCDQGLFDFGLVRVAVDGIGPDNRATFLYLRSDLLADIRQLDPRRAQRVSLSGLPRLGRYANQCLQVIGMTLYGARNNAAPALPEWTGNILFDLPPGDDTVAGPLAVSRSFSIDDILLWDRDGAAPVNVDFEAFFQAFPRTYALHKGFIRRMLRFQDRITARIHEWFEHNIPADSHLVTIHIRRGDYLLFQKDAPGLTVTPVDWYRHFLARMWPALSNPKLVVATDEPQMLQFFQEYQPMDISPSCPHLVGGAFVADFIALQRADIALICNSSFSRTATLLSCNDRQMVFKPGWAFGGFVPIDPWADRLFWDWYGQLDLPDAGILIDHAKRAAARNDAPRTRTFLKAALAVDPANVGVRNALLQME